METKKKPYQTWSRRVQKNDVTEEIEVCEAENGFIVTHSKWGHKKGKNGSEYFDEKRKYIAKENPLEEEEEKTFNEALGDILDEISESEGMVNVD